MSINKPCLFFVFVLIISVTLNVINCENSDDDNTNKNVEVRFHNKCTYFIDLWRSIHNRYHPFDD